MAPRLFCLIHTHIYIFGLVWIGLDWMVEEDAKTEVLALVVFFVSAWHVYSDNLNFVLCFQILWI